MGTDPFSNVKTHLRPWDVDTSMDTFLTRVDVAFEFFTKLLGRLKMSFLFGKKVFNSINSNIVSSEILFCQRFCFDIFTAVIQSLDSNRKVFLGGSYLVNLVEDLWRLLFTLQITNVARRSQASSLPLRWVFVALLPRLGVDYYCFHDVDVAPQGENLKEFQSNLDVISDKLLSKQKETGVKLFLAQSCKAIATGICWKNCDLVIFQCFPYAPG